VSRAQISQQEKMAASGENFADGPKYSKIQIEI